MDMTRDFINKIQETAAPNIIDCGGRMYVDKNMIPLPCGPLAQDALETESLSSVVDYITHNTDKNARGCERFVIHVESPKSVYLYTEMDPDKRRDMLVCAHANVNGFSFGRFMDVESFIINLQSNFVQDENTAKLLAFVASVRTDAGVEQNDDGISQKVTTRAGVLLSTTARVPNPIVLRPYRTFSEVDQPESAFVFRVKSEERDGVKMALFEADGSAWKHTAVVAIKDFFQQSLGDNVVVLA